MGLSILEAAAGLPVSLSEAKAQCRVDGSEEDLLITRLIGMATEQAEARTGRVFFTQKMRLSLDSFPPDSLEVPCPPLASVEAVSYINASGVRVVLSVDDYQVVTDEMIGRLLPGWGKAWPSCRCVPGSVRIDFTAGYGDAAAAPESVRSWILLSVGTLYKNREAIAAGQIFELPSGFWDGLLDPYRVWR